MNKGLFATLLGSTIFLSIALSIPFNINNANKTELIKTIPNLTEANANAIIKYRDEHGPFRDINDLLSIEGLNEELLKNFSNNQFEFSDIKNITTGTTKKMDNPTSKNKQIERDDSNEIREEEKNFLEASRAKLKKSSEKIKEESKELYAKSKYKGKELLDKGGELFDKGGEKLKGSSEKIKVETKELLEKGKDLFDKEKDPPKK